MNSTQTPESSPGEPEPTIRLRLRLNGVRLHFTLSRYRRNQFWAGTELQATACLVQGLVPLRYCCGCSRVLTEPVCELRRDYHPNVTDWAYFHSTACLKRYLDRKQAATGKSQ